MKLARLTGFTQGTLMRSAALALISLSCLMAVAPAARAQAASASLVPVEELAAARSTRERNEDDDDNKRKRKPVPDRRRPTVVIEKANPAAVGLGAAGGAFAGAMIGVVGTSAAAFFALGLAGQQTPAVMVSAAVVALGLAAATPFLAALGGGAAVILLDPRSSKDEWTGLLQCAAAGYCLGVSMIAGSVCGAPMFCGPSMGTIPGPDRPAEWTGGAAIAGLFAGGVSGALIGWVVAPNPNDPLVPIAAGALGGAAIGSSLSAGVGAAIATALRP